MSRRMQWLLGGLLALSLAANLFFGGLLLGRTFSGARVPLAEQGVQRFLQTLPEQARPLLLTALLAHREEIRTQLRDIAAARQRIAALIVAPEPDRAQLQAAFAVLQARTADVQRLLHRVLLEAALQLPPEVRAQWRLRWESKLGGFPALLPGADA